MKIKFLRRIGGVYYWEATRPNDNNTVRIKCNALWFWGIDMNHSTLRLLLPNANPFGLSR